jgi:hypothetical protein
MTEAEWLACTDPHAMLAALMGHPRSVRKLRLFCCACGRAVWKDLGRANRELIRWQEDHPDETADRGRFGKAGWFDCLLGPSPVGGVLVVPRPRRRGRGPTAAGLLHCVLGNPFRPATVGPAWLTPAAVSLAHAAYEERSLPSGRLDNSRLAVLSDALEEAGCSDEAILGHLRSPGPHVRGCWALDLMLGKE